MPHRHPSIARALGEVRRVLAGDTSGPGDRRILVAASGGADSTALLGLLGLLAPGDGLGLCVGHVDHGLRPESHDEAAAVAALASTRGLECRITRVDLRPGPGLPARAREARRAALRAQAAALGASRIALGHTATDQAETVLLHLTRGAGLDGAAAMSAIDPPWIRPLLGVTRSETAALCRRLGLGFVDDPTNHDPASPRVRLREQVLPILRAHNPAIERSLGALSRQARDADEALEVWAEREALARRVPAEGGGLRWRVDDLATLPRAVRTRALRRMLLAAGADRAALGERVVADIDRALAAREAARGRHGAALGPREWHLRPKVRLRLDRDGLSAP